MEVYMPYIVSVVCAVISGWVSYAVATKNAKNNLEAVKESNKHDLEKLMEQHKVDIDSLERIHKMEIEKINLEHAHQMELKQQEFENQLGGNAINTILSEAMKMPEIRQQISNSVKNGSKRRK